MRISRSIERSVVVVGSSIGGLEGIPGLLSRLPVSFGAPVVVVQHLGHPSRLVEILGRHTRLSVSWAHHGHLLHAGHVYVAPPDRHVLIDPDGRLSLSRGEKVHFARPAIDPLFYTAASVFKERTLAVLLTGANHDGVVGVRAVRQAGGRVIVQHATHAPLANMPRAAIATGCVDFVLPLSVIASALTTFVMVPGTDGIFGARAVA